MDIKTADPKKHHTAPVLKLREREGEIAFAWEIVLPEAWLEEARIGPGSEVQVITYPGFITVQLLNPPTDDD